MAGKTDLQIIKEGLELHKIPYEDGIIPEFCRVYLENLKEQVHRGNDRHIKPGIVQALEAIRGRKGFIPGLLTGNIEGGASIKLGAFGLSSYFDFGVFGNDHEDRNMLLPLALEKLSGSRALKIDFRECAVIGDTPRDVLCSKPHGALSIGVATGPYTFNELLQAGADAVFENLSDTEKFISVLDEWANGGDIEGRDMHNSMRTG